MKKLLIIVALLGFNAREAVTQLPSFFPAHSVLVDTWYPLLGWAGKNGFTAGGFYSVTHPLTFDAPDYRPPYLWSISLQGAVTQRGSRRLKLKAKFPGYGAGWRFRIELTTERRALDDYYGLGNNPDFDARDLPGASNNFNRADRLSTFAHGEVQRRIATDLWVLAGFHAEHWRVAPVSGPSLFADDQAADLAAGGPVRGTPTDDVTGRIGLVYDTRSDETAPRSGVLLQAILSAGDASVLGDLTYRRATASASGYVALNDHLVLAGRALTQTMSGDQRIGSFYLLDNGRGDDFTFGGRSHRGLPTNGILGPNKLLFNFDARYDVFPYPSFLPVTVVGWVDAGRVFYNEGLRLTLDDMNVGAGTGLFIQIGRSGVLGMTVGKGPAGISTNIHSRWPF